MVKKRQNKNIPARCEVANETPEGVDLYLYGTIEDDDSLMYYYEDEIKNLITPGKVRDLVNEVGNKDINIRLNSNGGSVYGSVAIMNYLKNIPNKVNIFIDAVAFSGGSIIAMSGDTLNMYPNSMLMIHQASSSFYGNADEFIEMSKVLNKFDEVVFNSYLSKFNGTEDELKLLIENESYLSATDCKNLGLCDIIIGEEQTFPTIENIKNKVDNLIKEPTKDKPEVKPEVEEDPITPEPDKPEPKEEQGPVKNKSILDKFKKEKGAI